MIFNYLARRRADKKQARQLVDWTVATARSRFADRFDDEIAQDDTTRRQRFEAVCAVAAVVATRLEEGGLNVKKRQTRFYAAQLFDRFDIAMREGGVGDMSIGPRIRRLASAFYGRWRAYGTALLATDEAALAAAMQRNGLAETQQAGHDARWLIEAYQSLKQQPISQIGQ